MWWAGSVGEPDRLSSSRKEQVEVKVFREGGRRIGPLEGVLEDWDAGGEMYRQKIEALRNTVGNSYLSVLSEETWTTSRPADFSTPNVPSGTAMRTAHTPIHAPQAQAIHSGRTLG